MKKEIIIASLLVLFSIISFFGVRRYLYRNSLYFIKTGISRRKLQKNNGLLGEYYIFKNLCKMKGKNHILLNVYLPTAPDKTTECDVIFISSGGVFVIESKNLSGTIYGDIDVKYWTQTLGGKNYSFYNPVSQNQTHIRAIIRNIITNREHLYQSILVFGNHTNLRNIKVREVNTFVIKAKQVRRTIVKIEKKQGELLNSYQIDEIYHRLLPYTKADYFVKKDHIRHVKNVKWRG